MNSLHPIIIILVLGIIFIFAFISKQEKIAEQQEQKIKFEDQDYNYSKEISKTKNYENQDLRLCLESADLNYESHWHNSCVGRKLNANCDLPLAIGQFLKEIRNEEKKECKNLYYDKK
jgi:hypothetical protein